MSDYRIDGRLLADFGAVAVVDGEAIALSGVFDIPKRVGDTEYNWKNEVEAFVEASDIKLDGRTLGLTMVVKGSSFVEYSGRLSALVGALKICRVLGCEMGEFAVIVKDDIKVDEWFGQHTAVVKVKFWQRVVSLGLLDLVPAGAGVGSYRVDGYDLWGQFKVRVSERDDNLSVARRLEVSTTAPYEDVRYRGNTLVVLKCVMLGEYPSELYTRMMSLGRILYKPGYRQVDLPAGSFSGWLKDGVDVKCSSLRSLEFDLRLFRI